MRSCHSTGAIALRGRLDADQGGLFLDFKNELGRIMETIDEKHGWGSVRERK
jgi:hypothetical protein